MLIYLRLTIALLIGIIICSVKQRLRDLLEFTRVRMGLTTIVGLGFPLILGANAVCFNYLRQGLDSVSAWLAAFNLPLTMCIVLLRVLI